MKPAHRTRDEVQRLAFAVRALHAARPELTHRKLGEALGLDRNLVTFYLSDRCKAVADGEGFHGRLVRLMRAIVFGTEEEMLAALIEARSLLDEAKQNITVRYEPMREEQLRETLELLSQHAKR